MKSHKIGVQGPLGPQGSKWQTMLLANCYQTWLDEQLVMMMMTFKEVKRQ